MKGDSTHVRVSKVTLARLQRYARSIVDNRATGRGRQVQVEIDPEPINPSGCGLSMDAAINLLLDKVDRNRKAGRESSEARRKRMPPVEGEC